jgi:hypothetical protein
MELTIGMKFTSKWFEGITEILAINKDENSIVVEISREGGHSHQENWNMEHTIWGFQRGEYLLIESEFKNALMEAAMWEEQLTENEKSTRTHSDLRKLVVSRTFDKYEKKILGGHPYLTNNKMTTTATDNTAQGVEVEEKPQVKSIWKTIELRRLNAVIGVNPQTIAEKSEEENLVNELVEGLQINDIGVLVKTVVYDGYLPSVTTVFIPGAKLLLDSKREVDGSERYNIVK